MKTGFYLSTIGKALHWAQAQSLSYLTAGSCCCADEILESFGCRYDIERFGCVPMVDPHHSDLLIVSGAVSFKAVPYLRKVYETMMAPKYVIAIGACSICGGQFAPESSYSVVAGVDRVIPVDVYVPGCPPRPEAIMNGLIALQEKIRGNQRASVEN
jgi:NADH-quinone oxidoreductase subunit B